MRINIHVKQMSAKSSRQDSSQRSGGRNVEGRSGEGSGAEGSGAEGSGAEGSGAEGSGADRRPRGRPPTIDRDAVLDTALGLLDAEGVEALTMRRLASELGVSAMTPYRYVG